MLQHANNLVDWYPWGEEALNKAKVENKPIFLSIGYAACHWCHRMREESFEDPETASLMNQEFISIKADRKVIGEKRNQLSRYADRNPLFALPRNVSICEISFLNGGILFDLELPIVWNKLTDKNVEQMERIWVYRIT